jgi:hypothetical protein
MATNKNPETSDRNSESQRKKFRNQPLPTIRSSSAPVGAQPTIFFSPELDRGEICQYLL